MIDEKITRVKALIQQRERIDAELATIFGIVRTPKRGRPRREETNGAVGDEEAVGSHEQPAPVDGVK